MTTPALLPLDSWTRTADIGGRIHTVFGQVRRMALHDDEHCRQMQTLLIKMKSEKIMFEYIHHVAYVVSDIEDALRIFRDTFELELTDRRIIEGETSFEMAAFHCGPTLIEILRPINHPALAQFLEEYGPGLHHVGFAMKDLSKRVKELKEKRVSINGPFIAGTGWNIAYFDFEKSDLDLLKSCYHGDHLAEANTQ